MHPDGGAGEKALVILSAPTDWEYDNYTTFTRDGVKVAEVLNLWPAASGASPFTDAMTDVGFWHDDAQVCSEVTEKFWGDVPGIWVYVEEIEKVRSKSEE